MPLANARAAFSHPDWIFELKWDGFRAIAYIDSGRCKLVSRKGNDFKSFPSLNESIASAAGSRSAVLDGEIVCLDRRGKPQFTELLFRRGEPRFVAFDLLRLDGEDLRVNAGEKVIRFSRSRPEPVIHWRSPGRRGRGRNSTAVSKLVFPAGLRSTRGFDSPQGFIPMIL